jgi:hypothetical protein
MRVTCSIFFGRWKNCFSERCRRRQCPTVPGSPPRSHLHLSESSQVWSWSQSESPWHVVTCRDMLWLSVPYVFSYVFWIFTFFQRFDNALNISSRQISCRSKISYLGSRKKNILLQFIT